MQAVWIKTSVKIVILSQLYDITIVQLKWFTFLSLWT
jgi:hypothetical protein